MVSFAVLEPRADGFRDYVQAGQRLPPETLLVERADMLTLTAPEMTVLVGGMRALNLLDMGTEWKSSPGTVNQFEGRDRATGAIKWTATSVDLIFGANSELRAISEIYASADGEGRFVRDFAAAWGKVMNLDRFDLS